MSDKLSNGIIKLKTEFANTYKGNSHLYETIPLESSELISIDDYSLEKLHKFAQNNPIYTNSYETKILEIPCKVYEGDFNEYWINSIKHDTSYAPFYPTWILSAYAITKYAKELGFEETVDIGSGDGRIAFCGKVVGMKSYGIEIDENLVLLQELIAKNTGIEFNPKNSDAINFDYESLNLKHPAFFIGGLPEVGEMLANGVIQKISSINVLKNNAAFVLTGTNSFRETSRDTTKWGWGLLIKNLGLDVLDTLTLPTRWTVDQPVDTPYVFTSRA